MPFIMLAKAYRDEQFPVRFGVDGRLRPGTGLDPTFTHRKRSPRTGSYPLMEQAENKDQTALPKTTCYRRSSLDRGGRSQSISKATRDGGFDATEPRFEWLIRTRADGVEKGLKKEDFSRRPLSHNPAT